MKLTIYQVDAFAQKEFEGNPAAIIPLEEWLEDETMQNIASENNISETAFFISTDRGFHIRWFTPQEEVKLCGHSTLAAAYVIFNILKIASSRIVFDSLSGPLLVTQNSGLITLDFPSQPPAPCETPSELIKALKTEPTHCLASEDIIAVFESEAEVANLTPDYDLLKRLDHRGVIATAPSRNYDFVVRFFAPKVGVLEDPVTGSAYTQLTPYWSEITGKSQLEARQISKRGGDLYCQLQKNRVFISGTAVSYLEGSIHI